MKKLFLFLIFVTTLFCIQLNVSVFDPNEVRLFGTNVSVYKGEELLAFNKTTLYHKLGENPLALATFDLEQGVYFVVIERGYYQPKIYLVELNSPTYLKVILTKESPTYSLYGKLKNSTYFEGKEIFLIDKKGLKRASSKIYEGGYFLFYSLYPQTEYRLMFEDEKQKLYSQYFSYDSVGLYYLELDLLSQTHFETKSVIFNSPQLVFVGQPIKVILKYGETPLKNKSILVFLPSNLNFTIFSDEFGVATINAAEEGVYKFVYENYTTQTIAKSLEQSKSPPPQETGKSLDEDTKGSLESINKTQQPIEKANLTSLAIKNQKTIEAELFLLAVLTIFISLILLILIYFLFLKRTK